VASPRLRAIDTTDLETRDTGDPNVGYGSRAVAFRNYYDNANSGVPDVALFDAQANQFYLYLGDNAGGSTFSPTARLTFQGGAAETIGFNGQSISTGYNPSINKALSDIDGDGIDDICAGTAAPSGLQVYVFYGADTATSVNANTVSWTSAAQLRPTLRQGTDWRSVQPVGDITGDGHVDIIIGEPDANNNQGGITVLY
jgi:hypothetical protein